MNVILWGAGVSGLRALYMLDQEAEVLAFVDSDDKKIGQKLNGIEIIPPDRIHAYHFDYILISNVHGKEISEALAGMGIPGAKIIDVYGQSIFDARVGTLRAISDEIYNNHISGSVAELGVYRGDFAKYINVCFSDRELHLFDTFEGFDEKDVKIDTGYGLSNAVTGEFRDTDIHLVLRKMKFGSQCKIHKGYFPDSAKNLEAEFCFVSIDVDLYTPIYEGLTYFYDRLLPGGYIMIHDYNNPVYKGVKKAAREFCAQRHINLVPLMDTAGSTVICK